MKSSNPHPKCSENSSPLLQESTITNISTIVRPNVTNLKLFSLQNLLQNLQNLQIKELSQIKNSDYNIAVPMASVHIAEIQNTKAKLAQSSPRNSPLTLTLSPCRH